MSVRLNTQVYPGRPLGIVLIRDSNKCLLYGYKLLTRKDRPTAIVIYNYQMGAVPGKTVGHTCSFLLILQICTIAVITAMSIHAGTHFHKYCTSRTCGFIQDYGYYSKGGASAEIFFNCNWNTLEYFVSSRETAFSMKLMEQFEANILLGKQSFKQCASVYSYLNREVSRYVIKLKASALTSVQL